MNQHIFCLFEQENDLIQTFNQIPVCRAAGFLQDSTLLQCGSCLVDLAERVVCWTMLYKYMSCFEPVKSPVCSHMQLCAAKMYAVSICMLNLYAFLGN